jgi:hypothetical protein
MTVRAIRLQNIRGFANSEIELKPLTVLLGPNSSGKSSFGQVLAAMAHAHWLNPQGGGKASLTPNPMQANEWPVELGTTDDLRTKGASGPVKVDIETTDGWVTFGFGGLNYTPDLLISYASFPDASRAAATPLRKEDLPKQPIAGATSTFDQPVGTIYPRDAGRRITAVRSSEHVWWDEQHVDQMRLTFEGLVLATAMHASGGTEFVPKNAAMNQVSTLLSSLGYLRGTRARPRRRFDRRNSERQLVGYGGEFTADALLRHGVLRVGNVHPPPFGLSPSEIRSVVGQPWTATQQSLNDAVGWWLSHLGLGRSANSMAIPDDSGRVMMRVQMDDRKESLDITEIGLGVSQVLPIIVGGLLQPVGSVFVVDLPEAHLHPRPQGPLADFFASLALMGKHSLVETHSEMFFHQLRYLTALNPTLRDKIAVYFIDRPTKEGRCEQPRRISLDYEGETQWPAGFLDEGWEMMDRIKAARTANSQA